MTMKLYEQWSDAEIRRMNVHRYDPISKLRKLFPGRTDNQIAAARDRSKKGKLKFKPKMGRPRLTVQLDIPEFQHSRTTQEYVCGYL
jgi:hypothetical protein